MEVDEVAEGQSSEKQERDKNHGDILDTGRRKDSSKEKRNTGHSERSADKSPSRQPRDASVSRREGCTCTSAGLLVDAPSASSRQTASS